MEKHCLTGLLLMAYLIFFPIRPRTIWPGLAPTVSWAFLHQTIIKKMPQRLTHRPIWQGHFFFSIEVLPSQIIPACVKSIKRTNQDMRTILTKYHILKEWTSTHSLTFWRPWSSRSRVSFILRLLSSACKVYILSLYLHMALPPKFLFQDHYLIKI